MAANPSPVAARSRSSSARPCSAGNVYLDTLELRSRTAPWAGELARRTGFAVRTGVLLVNEVVIIHHELRPDGSRQMPEVGIVIPAHASALGKAIAAFSAEAQKAAARQR